MEHAENTAKKHPVRRRTRNQGSETRPRKVTIRVTERISNELASMQGLIYKFGNRVALSDIFEGVLMPAMRKYVAPLVERARMERLGA